MKLRALVRDRESIERFLRHEDLWTEPLGLAEARPPPYFRSVTRLRSSRTSRPPCFGYAPLPIGGQV